MDPSEISVIEERIKFYAIKSMDTSRKNQISHQGIGSPEKSLTKLQLRI